MRLLKNFQNLLHITLYVIVAVLVFDRCFATPQLNQQDPYVIYSAKCSDKFYEKRDKTRFKFGLAPFYQQTHYARNGYGRKVPLNEMNGQWNMLAPFFSVSTMTPNTFNATTYPNLYTSKQNLLINGIDYSLESNYQPDSTIYPNGVTSSPMKSLVSFVSGKCDYEKVGLRGKIGFDFGCGLGINVKSGVVDYKYTGSVGVPQPAAGVQPASGFWTALLSDSASTGIFNDLQLDIKRDSKTTFEDTHVEIYFQAPFDLKDAGETVVVFAPYFSIGGWFPTGEQRDYKKFHSLPTGNNGHYCLTLETSLNFDFPGTIQLSVGGGALIADTREYSVFRFPTNQYQEGFYPWTTSVKEDPGTTWYFNASFKAENFLYDLSFYFDYVYTYHDKDDITIQEPSSNVNAATRRIAFASMLPTYLDRTIWKDQKFNAGLDYRITDNLKLGFAIQAHISGIRVFKSTTEMGYIDLSF